MGKVLENVKLFSVTGDEFTTAARDPTRQAINGNETVQATTALALRDLCLVMWGRDQTGRLFFEGGSYTDSETAERIIHRCRNATANDAATLEIDEADWTWAKEKARSVGVKIWGANAPTVVRAIETVVGPPAKEQAAEIVDIVRRNPAFSSLSLRGAEPKKEAKK